MKSILEELVGLRITGAEIVVDYLQVVFENGTRLSVYNKHQITTSDGLPESEQALVGSVLSAVDESKAVIKFTFSNLLALAVDRTEDGYLGPEAMELNRPGMPTVVWRADD